MAGTAKTKKTSYKKSYKRYYKKSRYGLTGARSFISNKDLRYKIS